MKTPTSQISWSRIEGFLMRFAGDDCSSWIMIPPIASFQHVAVLARKKLALAGLHYSVGSMRECG